MLIYKMSNNLSLIKDTYYFGIKKGSYNGFIIGFISGFFINKLSSCILKNLQNSKILNKFF